LSLFRGGASRSEQGSHQHRAAATLPYRSTALSLPLGGGRGLSPSASSLLLTPSPPPPRLASKGMRSRDTTVQRRSNSRFFLLLRPPRPVKRGRGDCWEVLHHGSRQPEQESRRIPANSSPRRACGGDPRSSAWGPNPAGLLGELHLNLDPTTVHHGRRGEEELGCQPAPPQDVGERLRRGRPPETEKNSRLLPVQGGRPSLSQSLRPAAPSEKRERGAGGSTPPRYLSRESKGVGEKGNLLSSVLGRSITDKSLDNPSAHNRNNLWSSSFTSIVDVLIRHSRTNGHGQCQCLIPSLNANIQMHH
jgi:hypothetical protein